MKWSEVNSFILEAQVGQKSLTWIRLIMVCYTVPWWPSWLSDQIAFSSSESDVVWTVIRLLPWLPSWILELNNFSNSPWRFPSSFAWTWLTVWEEMWFEEFQDGHHGCRLWYRNGTIFAIFIPITPQCLPSSLSSILLTIQEQMWTEDFQDGCHGGLLGYQDRTLLAILNLHVAPMPSTKFQLNLTYCLGAEW